MFFSLLSKRTLTLLVLLAILIAMETKAVAGGLEYPDNGSEAMGRGAAFTAKADDGTALIYNVAGFARQRGVRLTLGSNTAFHTATFQRAGTYPDNPSDPFTPWGGKPYPLVKNTGSPLPIPHLMLSHDLGTDRLTVAVGLYAPSVLGGRVFPVTVDNKPSPSRYDATRSGGLIAYPSIAAAYRVTDWLDFGAAVNFVIASLEATSVSSADLAKALCPNQEYQPCDSRQTIRTTGGTVAFSLGAMLRPAPWLQIGGQFRTPHTLETEGSVQAQAPRVQPAAIPPGKAFLTQPFPWIARGGIRYIGLRDKFEAYDVEADMTYEAWGSALADGTKVYIPKLSVFDNIRSTIKVGFQDTMSFRVGGSYNVPLSSAAAGALPKSVLSLRAGAYHDTAATKNEDTRLLFDSLAKTGITIGAGVKTGPVAVNVALAKIFHETREVTNGQLRPINGSQGGKPIDSTGALYQPINNGTYTGSTWVIAAGITIQLEELFGTKHVPAYGDSEYEVTTKDLKPSAPATNQPNEEDEEAKRKSPPNMPKAPSHATPATEVATEKAWWESAGDEETSATTTANTNATNATNAANATNPTTGDPSTTAAMKRASSAKKKKPMKKSAPRQSGKPTQAKNALEF